MIKPYLLPVGTYYSFARVYFYFNAKSSSVCYCKDVELLTEFLPDSLFHFCVLFQV